MSNRRHLDQSHSRHHDAPRSALAAERDAAHGQLALAHPHERSTIELARERAMEDRARSSRSTTLASQANTMRLKKGNAGRNG
jgi:hypothetical protein